MAARVLLCCLLPLLILAGGVLAGCSRHVSPSASLPSLIDKNLQPTLQIFPQPARQMDPSTFTARVVDVLGKPVNDASVNFSLTMPTMDMGHIQLAAQPRGNGRYVGMGRFTMAGEWDVSVRVQRGKETTHRTFVTAVR